VPDFHQPDDEDRRRAARTADVEDTAGDRPERTSLEDLRSQAAQAGVAGAEHLSADELAAALRTVRPSSRRDPAAPDRPVT
jgi:hypothetical protein